MASQLVTSVNPRQTVEEAFIHILEVNLAALKVWEPIALAGEDIEGVHQMRVGLRRMRSALSVFRSAIPRKLSQPLAKEMRWTARALDRARDLDVYLAENFSGKGSKKQQKMQSLARRHRDEAYSRVRVIVQSKRYLSFNKEMINWLDNKAWRECLSEDERKVLRCMITPFAARVLEEHQGNVIGAGKEIEKLDSEALHRLRIECKKLRYAAEFFAPLYGERMSDFTRHLKALQDLLGTLHDTAILSGLQKDLLSGSHNSKLKRIADKMENKRYKESKEIKKNFMGRWQTFSEAEHPWGLANPRKVAA